MKVTIVWSILPGLAAFTAPSPLRTATSYTLRSDIVLNAETGANGSVEKKKVVVLGGDGFCGWPTSLYLSDQGHDIVIVDNLSRRKIDLDLGCDSLTPIQSPEVSRLLRLPVRPPFFATNEHRHRFAAKLGRK
jgi:UDP-sulfoquinovose synthase